jgi:hypothetical protein
MHLCQSFVVLALALTAAWVIRAMFRWYVILAIWFWMWG